VTFNNMHEKFSYAIGDIYDAERRLVEAQQHALERASNPVLRQMLQEHLGQSEQQIHNLDQVRGMLTGAATNVEAIAAVALIEQGTMLMQQASHNPALLDMVISDQQFKIEQMEIACYRTLITAAQAMGLRDAQLLLQQNLSQEEQMAEQIDCNALILAQAAIRPIERVSAVGQPVDAQAAAEVSESAASSGGAAGGGSAGMTPAIHGSGAGPATNEQTS